MLRCGDALGFVVGAAMRTVWLALFAGQENAPAGELLADLTSAKLQTSQEEGVCERSRRGGR
jgi:hypothetical protein